MPSEVRKLGQMLLAAEQAVDIGARILRQGRSHIGALIGKGDRDFATDVDLHIESEIRAWLTRATPQIPFLGEEGNGARELGGARWVLDPIDGTINFARDSPLCAISLSLLVAGQPVLGIVDAPLLGERFIARHGGGAYLNGNRVEMHRQVHRKRELCLTPLGCQLGAVIRVQLRPPGQSRIRRPCASDRRTSAASRSRASL